MHVMRDLLDKQIVDREEERLGRVDGIVAEIGDDAPPRVIQLELGFVPLARRLHRRFEVLVETLHERWSVRRGARFHIEWSTVMDVTTRHVQVDLRAEETPAYDWERWLRERIIGRIPGGSGDV
jgi:hypothetical protein